jgi:hypothetical protein
MGILILWVVCAIATAILASNKGRNAGGWLLLGILLGPLALLLAAVVSNKNVERQVTTLAAARAAEEGSLRKCPFCAEWIQREAVVCRFCGRDVPAAEPALKAAASDRYESLPRGSATRGYVYIALSTLLVAALIYGTIKSGSTPSTETATAENTVAARPVDTAGPSLEQRAYVATCNRFAWRGDKVQCEVAPGRTLRIYQRAEPSGSNPEADTVKYLYNHPDRLIAIKRAGFDKMEAVLIGGNGPGRNITATVAIRDDGTFTAVRSCYDGTDNQRHCDPQN